MVGFQRGERFLLDALDNVDVGMLLLTPELRVHYANAAFLKFWDLRPSLFDGRPDFAWIIRVIANRRLEPHLGNDLEKYIEERVTLVRRGEEDPRNTLLDDGRTLRIICKALPSGGRLMVYSDITDLVRQSTELQLLATVDSLTGLLNRREFLRVSGLMWDAMQSDSANLTAMMIDIDNFKSINDCNGHFAGDQAIIEVARIIRKTLPSRGLVCRYGGEEFLALFGAPDTHESKRLAETVRRRVAEAQMDGFLQVRLTVSIGIASTSYITTALDHLIQAADKAMYSAKRFGKNVVIAAERETDAELRLMPRQFVA